MDVGVARRRPSTRSTATTAAVDVRPGDRAVVALTSRTVVGASTPAGNASSISSKPSTDSTDFLKKVVVE